MTENKLVEFLYILLRDDITAGRMEQILRDHIEKSRGKTSEFCNPYIHAYSVELARRIQEQEVA